MIAKELMAGMKVVPISKSVGQNLRDWKLEFLRDRKYVVVREAKTTWEGRVWVCNIPDTTFVGYFLPKDLIPYQE